MRDIVTKYRDTPFLLAKLEYKKYSKILSQISPYMKEFIDNLYKIIPYKEMVIISTPELPLTNEALIEIAHDFIKSLNNKELLDAIDYLIKNNLIEFREKNDELSQYVNGLTLSGVNKVIIYRDHTANDIKITIHELAHAITNYLYLDKENPIFSMFMSEYVAYYFELLFFETYFSSLYGGESILKDILESNRLVNICTNLYEIKLQSLAFKGLYFNPRRINKEFSKEENSFLINENDKSVIINENIYRRHAKTHSYLLALDTIEAALEDIEFGLYNFKTMLTEDVSKYSSIESIYQKYDIHYHEEPKNLKKELKKHDILKSRINEE